MTTDFVKKAYVAGVQFTAIDAGLLQYPTEGACNRAVEKTAVELDGDEFHTASILEHLIKQSEEEIKEAEAWEEINTQVDNELVPYAQALLEKGASLEDTNEIIKEAKSEIIQKLLGAGKSLAEKARGAGKAVSEKARGAGKAVSEKARGAGKAVSEKAKNVAGDVSGSTARKARGAAEKAKREAESKGGKSKNWAEGLDAAARKAEAARKKARKTLAAIGGGGVLAGGGVAAAKTASMHQLDSYIENIAGPVVSELIKQGSIGWEDASETMVAIKESVFDKLATGVTEPNTGERSVSSEMEAEMAERPPKKYEADRGETATSAETENFPEGKGEVGEKKEASFSDYIADLVLEKMADGSGTEAPNTLVESVDSEKEKTTDEYDSGVGASAELESGEAEVGTETAHPKKEKGQENTSRNEGGEIADAMAANKIATITRRVLQEMQKQSDGSGTEAPNTLSESVDSEKEKTTDEYDSGVGASADLEGGTAEEGTETQVGMGDKGKETSNADKAKIAAIIEEIMKKKAQEEEDDDEESSEEDMEDEEKKKMPPFMAKNEEEKKAMVQSIAEQLISEL